MVNQGAPRAATAPLDPLALASSLAPFGESTMLPRDAYVSEAVFAWEQRHLLEGGWMCIGRSESMPEPNDQRAVSVGRGRRLSDARPARAAPGVRQRMQAQGSRACFRAARRP